MSFSILKRALFILISTSALCFFVPEIYAYEDKILLGINGGFLLPGAKEPAGINAYKYGKDLHGDVNGYPGIFPSFSLIQGLTFNDKYFFQLMEEFFVSDVDVKFSGLYFLDPDFFYRRNFLLAGFHFGLHEIMEKIILYFTVGGGGAYVITHTSGYFGDSKYSVVKPFASALLGLKVPINNILLFNAGLKFNYIFSLPETNYFYQDSGNFPLIGIDIGFLFLI